MQWSPTHAASRFGRAALTVLCCAVFVCGAALAQSGRRQQKPAEIAPVPTPTPEPTPLPPPAPAEQIQLMLLSDDAQSFDAPRDYSYLVRDAVSQRLREAKAFDITGGAKSANRGEAGKIAKLEKKRFVVWFRLVVPGMFGESGQEANVEFVVLEPETGKQKASGRAYVGSRRTGIGRGGIGLPGGGLPGSCYPTGMTREGYYLVEAAIEAADSVIQHFGVSLPPRCS